MPKKSASKKRPKALAEMTAREIRTRMHPAVARDRALSASQHDFALLAAIHNRGGEIALYEKTGNAAHLWAAYKVWREFAPDHPDMPWSALMSKPLLNYFDAVAAGIPNCKSGDDLQRLLKLSGKASGRRSGGPGAAIRARATREQIEIVRAIMGALWSIARTKTGQDVISGNSGPTPLVWKRGDKERVYRQVAHKYGKNVATIKTIATRMGVTRHIRSLQRGEPDDGRWPTMRRPKISEQD